jgi:hypothetical protein
LNNQPSLPLEGEGQGEGELKTILKGSKRGVKTPPNKNSYFSNSGTIRGAQPLLELNFFLSKSGESKRGAAPLE